LSTETNGVFDLMALMSSEIKQNNIDIAALSEALGKTLELLEVTIEESGRHIDHDAEDAFRMGEWFDEGDLIDVKNCYEVLAYAKSNKQK
jgi:hypothetical protein